MAGKPNHQRHGANHQPVFGAANLAAFPLALVVADLDHAHSVEVVRALFQVFAQAGSAGGPVAAIFLHVAMLGRLLGLFVLPGEGALQVVLVEQLAIEPVGGQVKRLEAAQVAGGAAPGMKPWEWVQGGDQGLHG